MIKRGSLFKNSEAKRSVSLVTFREIDAVNPCRSSRRFVVIILYQITPLIVLEFFYVTVYGIEFEKSSTFSHWFSSPSEYFPLF